MGNTQVTQEQAIALYEGKFYEGKSYREIAEFQMTQDRLCMPFEIFHEAISKALNRSVFTHEFGLNRDGLTKELAGEKEAPTFEQIINMIPADKRMLINLGAGLAISTIK